MIASTIAATLAAASPQAAAQPAPAPKAAHDHMAMGQHGSAAKMDDCCKDGCACCAKKDAKPAK